MNWDSWPYQCSGELEVPDAEKAHLLGSQPKIPQPCLSGAPGAHWQRQEVPPHWAICLGTDLICFPSQSSCLLGKEGWSGFELGRESSPHLGWLS